LQTVGKHQQKMDAFKIKVKQIKYWHNGNTRYGLFLPAYLKINKDSFTIYHKEFACLYNAMNDLMPLKYFKARKEPKFIYFDIFNRLIIVEDTKYMRTETIIKGIQQDKDILEIFFNHWSSFSLKSPYQKNK